MSNLEDAAYEPEQNPSSLHDQALPQAALTNDAPAELFQSWSQPEVIPPARIPHLGHLALLSAFLLLGFVCMMVLMAVAMHFHLDGVSTSDQIKTNIHYLLGT